MTRLPAPDDRQPRNGQLRDAGDDSLEAQQARLAGFWALVLRRFRAFAQRSAADRHRQQEGR
jgi:hypothetical protein